MISQLGLRLACLELKKLQCTNLAFLMPGEPTFTGENLSQMIVQHGLANYVCPSLN